MTFAPTDLRVNGSASHSSSGSLQDIAGLWGWPPRPSRFKDAPILLKNKHLA